MSLRDQMPESAAIVDDLRAMLGRELVDAAIVAGRQLQRQHAALAAEQGPAVADRWLARQAPSGPVFACTEGGLAVGLMPGRKGQQGPISPQRETALRRRGSPADDSRVNRLTPGSGSFRRTPHQGNPSLDRCVDSTGPAS